MYGSTRFFCNTASTPPVVNPALSVADGVSTGSGVVNAPRIVGMLLIIACCTLRPFNAAVVATEATLLTAAIAPCVAPISSLSTNTPAYVPTVEEAKLVPNT